MRLKEEPGSGSVCQVRERQDTPEDSHGASRGRCGLAQMQPNEALEPVRVALYASTSAEGPEHSLEVQVRSHPSGIYSAARSGNSQGLLRHPGRPQPVRRNDGRNHRGEPAVSANPDPCVKGVRKTYHCKGVRKTYHCGGRIVYHRRDDRRPYGRWSGDRLGSKEDKVGVS